MSTPNPESTPNQHPQARVVPHRKFSILWFIPLLALTLSAWLILNYHRERGIPIQIVFQEGHGLKVGDPLKYRGIVVGVVDHIELQSDLEKIKVNARLSPNLQNLARGNTQFWIVRPQIGLKGPRGLDTVVGANYIQLLPGEGPNQHSFEGLDEPPVFAEHLEAGLRIRLTTPMATGLKKGASVFHRDLEVGKILDIQFANDFSHLEVQLVIFEAYRSLIREDTVFWKNKGARFKAGLFSGVKFDIGSMSSLLMGGIAFALPPNPGIVAKEGYAFELFEEPEDEWLEWDTEIPLDNTEEYKII